jgi:D-xylose transport system permease protein
VLCALPAAADGCGTLPPASPSSPPSPPAGHRHCNGLLITKVGIPSFVVTLAGLIAWNGVVLLLIADRGTIVLQNDLVVGFSNDFLPDAVAWIVALVAVAIYAAVLLNERRVRSAAGLPTGPVALLALRIGAFALILLAVVGIANQDRGIPFVLIVLAVLFLGWTFVLNRTRFGRHVYAVGATRRRRGGRGSTSTGSGSPSSRSAR